MAKPELELLLGERALRLINTRGIRRCDEHGYSVVDCRNDVNVCECKV